MFEDYTQEYIYEKMVENISDDIDTREGTPVYDSLMPFAIELQNAYVELDILLDECFADTSSEYYLAKRAAERGVLKREATSCIVKAAFYGGETYIGCRYNCEDYNYEVVDVFEGEAKNGIFYYKLRCETAGTEPNEVTGELSPISDTDYVDGLQYAEIIEVITCGEDEQDTESLRADYYNSLNIRYFAGNKADYERFICELEGVGACKIYPVWNGGGTVKVVFVSENFQKPSEDVVNAIQSQVDPVKDQGVGEGIAPIGHTVTIMACDETVVNVSATITYDDDYTFNDLKDFIESSIDEYLSNLNASWSESNGLIVRIAQIESRIISLDGILDISGTKINGEESNLVVDKDSIVVRGDVVG